MIDLHTHLLPDWDDGAKDWDEMRRMAEIASKDGIHKIVLTPHIFRLSKHNDDFAVLEQKMDEFKNQLRGIPMQFYRGAEVFVRHNLAENIQRHSFTINDSDYIFIEFPSGQIVPGAKELFYNLMLAGYIPIISHPERNAIFASRPDLLYEFVEAGSLGQVTAKSLTGEFGAETKKTADLFITHNLVHVIASDAHDPERRPPRLSAGVAEAARIVGKEKAEAMVTEIPQAILDNKQIPYLGDPVNPVNKKKWAIRLPRIKR